MSRREKILLSLVAAVLLIVGNLILLNWLRAEKMKAQQAIANLKPDITVNEFLLENKDYWLGANAWLASKAGPLPNLNEARVRLLDHAQERAREMAVELSSPRMPPVVDRPGELAEVRVGFEVQGEWGQVINFLAGLEDPVVFQGYANMNISKLKDDKIKVVVTLVQYFPDANLVASQ